MGRTAAAAALLLGPLLLLATTAVGPLNTGGTFAEMLRVYDAERTAIQVADLLAFAGALAMIAAVLAAARAVRRRAPAFALWGACLSVAGWASLIGLLGYDQAMVDVSRDPAIREQLARSLDNGEAWALPAIFAVFLVGTVAGGAVLGTALLRTRVVPVWAGAAVAVALVVNVVGHLVEVKAIALAAFVLLAAGFAALAVRVARTPVAAWVDGDVAPVTGERPGAPVVVGG
ncbi:MAG TPA: hypothetical protein VNT51_11100 [Miltoncostaeaceae bacterium]|nr:hypothetical protein [Miltoncostaeaceae bacterium]